MNAQTVKEVIESEEVFGKAAEKLNKIARICHQTNKAYCESIGDTSQVNWEDASNDITASAIRGVIYRLEHPDAPPSAQHDAWMKDKVDAGWVYGTEKDAEKKTHPCIVPYEELPLEQRRKDYLFQAIVDAMIKA